MVHGCAIEMPIQQVSSDVANAIAVSAGNPDLPNSGPGIYVVYDNHRYQLVKRNDAYAAFDVSVYSDDGTTLLTDATDVWINEIGAAGTDIVSGATQYFSGLIVIGILFAVLFFIPKGRNA